MIDGTRLAASLLATVTFLATLVSPGVTHAAPSTAPVVAPKLDNATCQSCHDGKKGKLEMLASNGDKRPVKTVVPDKYGKSVHARMDCVACHLEITDSVTPHAKSTAVKKAECAQCHLDLWEETK